MGLLGYLIKEEDDFDFFNEKTDPSIELLTIRHFRFLERQELEGARYQLQKEVNRMIKGRIGQQGIRSGLCVVNYGWGSNNGGKITIEVQIYLKLSEKLKITEKHKRILKDGSVEQEIYEEVKQIITRYFENTDE